MPATSLTSVTQLDNVWQRRESLLHVCVYNVHTYTCIHIQSTSAAVRSAAGDDSQARIKQIAHGGTDVLGGKTS
jgi:hypothetical protein